MKLIKRGRNKAIFFSYFIVIRSVFHSYLLSLYVTLFLPSCHSFYSSSHLFSFLPLFFLSFLHPNIPLYFFFFCCLLYIKNKGYLCTTVTLPLTSRSFLSPYLISKELYTTSYIVNYFSYIDQVYKHFTRSLATLTTCTNYVDCITLY